MSQRPSILREYLRRWKAEVGKFFDGVDATSTDDELARIAPAHPVFRVARWLRGNARALRRVTQLPGVAQDRFVRLVGQLGERLGHL